jgi:RNA polymerase sigma-70 factor (ECF subfamily)
MSATSQLQLKTNSLMTSSTKKVSSDAIQAEWQEIQAAQGNPALFSPLYDRYYEPIFRFIYRRTSNEMVSGDICAQVFLKAIQKLGGYRFQGVPFSAWLYRIASNEIAQFFRNQQKQRTVSIEDSNIGEMMDEVEIDFHEEHRAILLDTLNQMSEKEVELIELRFFEKRSFKEIAQILDITESNAKVKTYRLLDKMKKLMKNKIKH